MIESNLPGHGYSVSYAKDYTEYSDNRATSSEGMVHSLNVQPVASRKLSKSSAILHSVKGSPSHALGGTRTLERLTRLQYSSTLLVGHRLSSSVDADGA